MSSEEEEEGIIIAENDGHYEQSIASSSIVGRRSDLGILFADPWWLTEALRRLRSGDDSLTELDLSIHIPPGHLNGGDKLDYDQTVALADAVAGHPQHLESLDLSNCLEPNYPGQRDKITPLLNTLLSDHPTLTSLTLGRIGLEAVHAVPLSRALAANRCLTSLDLSANSLGDEGVIVLMEGLAQNDTLQYLNIGGTHYWLGNGIGDAGGFRAVGAYLRLNKSSLVRLSLAGNRLSLTAADDLADAVRANAHLLRLDLEECCEGNPGTAVSFIKRIFPECFLPTQVRSMSRLRGLDLSGNRLEAAHVQCLAKVLAAATSLESLDLSFNSLGNAGACLLAGGIRRNATLEDLDLAHNNMSEEGILALTSALQDSNYTLEELRCVYDDDDADADDIPREMIGVIDGLCESNRRLKATYEEMKGQQHKISRGLWPRALEVFSAKPHYVFSLLKASPQIVPERTNGRGRRRRDHHEAFGSCNE